MFCTGAAGEGRERERERAQVTLERGGGERCANVTVGDVRQGVVKVTWAEGKVI